MKIRLDDNQIEHVVAKALRRSLEYTKPGKNEVLTEDDVIEYRVALKVVLSWWEP